MEGNSELASKYKLTYFNIHGRGQPIRMMMALAGQPYEDNRKELEEWFEKHKQDAPLGKLPYLTTEDGHLTCSVAIYNFLATKLKFQPDSEWQRAQSESVMIAAGDLLTTVGTNVYVHTIYKLKPIPEDIEEKRQMCRDEIKKKIDFFSSVAKPGAKFLFGDKMTVADFSLYSINDYCCLQFPETRTVNKRFDSLISNMEADEKFADYLKNRPPSARFGT